MEDHERLEFVSSNRRTQSPCLVGVSVMASFLCMRFSSEDKSVVVESA